ncbi:ribonuclease III [Asticcacaulis sp. BYS171W]|uniref:Ribonuclease 3 n=1 Tax=Asticcacaulis aquaticus TaxID=2984212 RepID=A0ABT5HPC4_9CAUL|nr:ribonuclease III [Asticcacaulis aquaticus]MDC7681917.1 ribonuclease III [Asticcacaulis aquaticus]
MTRIQRDASAHRQKLLNGLEAKLGYTFTHRDLLESALTHASVGDGAKRKAGASDNERLEFLGDRVLGLMVAEALMEAFPDAAEGEMSQRLHGLVSRETCAAIAQQLGVGPALRLAVGETRSGGRSNLTILGDACEALIAAVYVDGGFDAARKAFLPLWQPHIRSGHDRSHLNPKSHLQEWAAQQKLPAPKYEVVKREGPDHAPIFTVAVGLEGYDPVSATGKSRQDAEKAAALRFIENEGLN